MVGLRYCCFFWRTTFLVSTIKKKGRPEPIFFHVDGMKKYEFIWVFESRTEHFDPKFISFTPMHIHYMIHKQNEVLILCSVTKSSSNRMNRLGIQTSIIMIYKANRNYTNRNLFTLHVITLEGGILVTIVVEYQLLRPTTGISGPVMWYVMTVAATATVIHVSRLTYVVGRRWQ